MPDATLDAYGRLLASSLFPLFEQLRGRPTLPLLKNLRRTERWPLEHIHDLQLGSLRRVLRHAYRHTRYYRELLDGIGMHPEDVRALSDLSRFPLLDRDTVVKTLDERTASSPRWTVQKSTSGTTGEPVVVRYNAESRYWRDATRWRGYGWAGYQIGMRAFHYWGVAPPSASWLARQKIRLDHALKRDRYVDCTPRSDGHLATAVAVLREVRPQVMIAYSSGAAALARFVVEHGLRDWSAFPVLVGAERLWPSDREIVEQAFGPAFETYGSREVMMIAAECEHHRGMHVSMETMIVELLVRLPDGSLRVAKPGETGEVAVTDLHNLACPMIRYVTGDLAVAREPETCACGRTLERIGPVEGRVAETLRDGHGQAVGGLVFNILFGVLDHVAKQFQVIQRRDRSVVMRVVPNDRELPNRAVRAIHDFARKYLPGIPFEIEYVAHIPLTAAGKRRVVTVERD